MAIPSRPFSSGKPVSASVLNAMSDVVLGVTNVAGGDGVSAQFVGNALQIRTSKGDVFKSELNFGILRNTGTDPIYAGEFAMVEGSIHTESNLNITQASQLTNYIKGGKCDFADDTKNHQAGDFVIALDNIAIGGSGRVIMSGMALCYIYLNSDDDKYLSEVNDISQLTSRTHKNIGQIIWKDGTAAPDNCWCIMKWPMCDIENLQIVKNVNTAEGEIPPFSACEIIGNELDGKILTIQQPSIDNVANVIFTDFRQVSGEETVGIGFGEYQTVHKDFATAEINYSPEASLPDNSYTYGTEKDSYVMRLGRIGFFSNRTFELTVGETTTPYADFNRQPIIPVCVQATGDVDDTDPLAPIIKVKALLLNGDLVGDEYDIPLIGEGTGS